MKPLFELLVLIGLITVLSLADSSIADSLQSDVPKGRSEATANLDQLYARAEQGDPDAQFRLGRVYEDGEIVERDLGKALAVYREAAEQGHAGAQYALAHIYHLGSGVEQDMAAAMVWYRKAARQGNEFAQLALGDQYRIGLVVPRDLAQSTKWYRMAADQGNGFAQYELGNAYRYGNGVDHNRAQAIAWYRLSAEAGNPSAQLALVDLEADGLVTGYATPEAASPADFSGRMSEETSSKLADIAPEMSPHAFKSATVTIVEEKTAVALPGRGTPSTSPVGENRAEPQDSQSAFAALPTMTDERVAQMLARAEHQVAKLALTTPAGNNAYDTYQRILSVQPDNSAVLEGIERIGVKYVELAGRAAAKGDLKNARQYAAKAAVLAPEHPRVLAMWDPTEANQPGVEETTRAPEILSEFKTVPDSPKIPEEAAENQQIVTATPAIATSEELFEDANDIVLKPHDYQSRQVAVAGSVVHLFWDYRLLADSGQNSIVIDVDGLSQSDQAALDSAIDEIGTFGQVRARIKGTIERTSLATFVLTATDVALIDTVPSQDQDLDSYKTGTLVVPVYPGALVRQTIGGISERARSADGAAATASAAGSNGGSDGAPAGGNGGAGSGGADGGSSDGGSSGADGEGSGGASASGSSGSNSEGSDGSSGGESSSKGKSKDKGKDGGKGKGKGGGKK